MKINTILLSVIVVTIVFGSFTLNMEMSDPNNYFDEELTLRAITMMLLLAPIAIYTFVKNI